MVYLLGCEHSSNNDVCSQDVLDNLSQEDLEKHVGIVTNNQKYW